MPSRLSLALAAGLGLMVLTVGCASMYPRDDSARWGYNPNDANPGGPGWYSRP